ncbi:MAG TPA: universal stress protein [Gaiellaceae bacterium]|nr:universal stress protein [Gaiellaceae bacterium]
MDVLVGYDGSDAAKRALSLAASLAGDGRLTIANVAPALRFGLPDPLFAEEQESLLAEALALVGREEGTAAVGLVGDAADELARVAAEAGAGLVAVGTNGRGAVGRFLVGSVSLALARQAPTDVLVVP